MKTVKLTADDGMLFVPFETIVDELQRTIRTSEGCNPEQKDALLIVRYDAGDADTCPWPMLEKHEERLKRALYDAREMGLIPADAREVILPDGQTFLID